MLHNAVGTGWKLFYDFHFPFPSALLRNFFLLTTHDEFHFEKPENDNSGWGWAEMFSSKSLIPRQKKLRFYKFLRLSYEKFGRRASTRQWLCQTNFQDEIFEKNFFGICGRSLLCQKIKSIELIPPRFSLSRRAFAIHVTFNLMIARGHDKNYAKNCNSKRSLWKLMQESFQSSFSLFSVLIILK